MGIYRDYIRGNIGSWVLALRIWGLMGFRALGFC